MKKIIIVIIALTFILTVCLGAKNFVNNTTGKTPTNTTTDTPKSPFEKGYYNYKGTIGDNIAIQMSIYPLGKDMVGSYFYESQRKEITLKGKSVGKAIELYEYDRAGKNTGTFKGAMSTVDKIQGTWISEDNKKSYPFTLSLKSVLPGTEYGKRYAVAVGAMRDQDVENFVMKIQSYVINNNKKQLAKEVRYPIKVKIKGKVIKIQNEADFINNYDKIFHTNYRLAISKAFTKYLFANFQGIMFYAGLYNIWINEVTPNGEKSKLMIIAINN